MRLFIAEKPNLGKAIARGLGGGRTEQGCIRCGDNIVTWCFGHLLEPAYPEAYCPEYAQWRREHLPIIPSSWKYVVKRTSKAQLDTIGKLLRDAASVVHAGDPDREGQLLVDEVLEHFRYRGPVFRIWLPSLDDRSVSIALGNITDNAANAPLRDAARARMMADWLVGINATRALTITGRENGRTEVLSLGRVQTPTLALVVARDREIAHFKPSDYFVLRASIIHPHGECSVTFVPSDSQDGLDSSGRLVDLAQVAAVLESVNGKEGTVLESLREKKTRPAPLPHCLSSLQKSASARLGMSAKRVLDVAQSLYEKKLTTYPRTDCRYLPEEQHGEAASILSSLAGVSGLEQHDLRPERVHPVPEAAFPPRPAVPDRVSAQHGQGGPALLAPDGLPRHFHGLSDIQNQSTSCCRSSTTLPSWSRTQRRAVAAMPLSWVIRITVVPSRLSCWRNSSTSWPVRESRAPVGSSAMMMGGFAAMARAMATRCCWPPDISAGLCFIRPDSPTRPRAATAIS